MTTSRRSRRALALLFAAAACGGGGNGGEAGEATSETLGATETGAPTSGGSTGGADGRQRLCDFIFGCGCEVSGYSSVAACVMSYDLNIQLNQGLAAQWGLTYDPSCLEAYADEVIGAGCITPDELAARPKTCFPCSAVHGDLAEGQPCTRYNDEVSDCAQGLECEGICYDPCKQYGPGEPCGNDEQGQFADCQPDHYCDYATHLCEPLPQPGAPCDAGDGCVSGHICDDVTDPMSPVCVPRPTAGEPCTTDDCADDLVCGQDDNVCREPPGAGEPCNWSECAAGNWCDLNDKTCKPRGPAGAPCEDAPECAENTTCSLASGTCTMQAAWFCAQP